MSDCVLFAGQSIQEQGMCRELWKLPAARKILERLTPSLGADLERISTEMPDADLALTLNAQRAIHAHHLGHWFAYAAKHPEVKLGGAIGHSMGVVAALVAAGALTVEDSGKFLRARAEAFSEVCKTFTEPMGLAAVSTDNFQDVVDELGAFPDVSVALYNTKTRGTLGGTTAALEAFARKADEEGWPLKVRVLKVEGPYHTKAFTPCKEKLRAAAAAIQITAPSCPVFMGTSGKAETDPARIRALLVDQADSCERHLEAVQAARAAGCARFIEVARKPQPVTWLNDQLDGGYEAAPVTTEQLAAEG
jgi:[acyl-carrier-protein] S-malonyltransferase